MYSQISHGLTWH